MRAVALGALLCVSARGFVARAPLRATPARAAPVLRRAETTESLESELAIVDELEPPSAAAVVPPPQPARNTTPIAPYALLLLVTALWGSQHAVIRWAVADEQLGPAAVNAGRFAIAALICSPWTPRFHERETWRWGAELGFWSFLGFALQAVGLETTSATRSAFLLYLNVKLVPVLAFLLYGRQIAARTWASAAVAVAGTTLLSFDGTPPCAGDGWSLAAALTSAAFILRLERYSSRFDAAALNAATLATTAALCAGWALTAAAFDSAVPGAAELPATLARQAELMAGQAPALLYLSLVTTALANWLQALGQKSVSAQDAAIVYALDPVYGALFAAALLGERLGPQGLAGAAVVLAAVALSRGGEEGE